MSQRSNSDIFFRALSTGMPVEFRGYVYQVIPAGKDIVCPSGIYTADYDVLVTVGTSYKGDEPPSKIMLPCDVPYNTLNKMVANMTPEERIGMVGATVLMQTHTKKR